MRYILFDCHIISKNNFGIPHLNIERQKKATRMRLTKRSLGIARVMRVSAVVEKFDCGLLIPRFGSALRLHVFEDVMIVVNVFNF